jgi:hypothetical protein
MGLYDSTPTTPDESQDPVAGTKLEPRARWQRFFAYTPSQVQIAMEDFSADPHRLEISDELWAAVAQEQETTGHDKWSYTYALMQRDKTAIASRLRHSGRNLNTGPRYLFELQEPLDTPDVVQELANLTEHPVEVPIAYNVPGRYVVLMRRLVKLSQHTSPHPKEPSTRSTLLPLLPLKPPRRYQILLSRLHLVSTRHSRIGV